MTFKAHSEMRYLWLGSFKTTPTSRQSVVSAISDLFTGYGQQWGEMQKIQTRSQVPTLWNTNIEVVQPWTAWYFSDVSTVKGRKGVDRPYLCIGVPKDSYIRKKSKISGQLTTRIKYQTGQISCTECWMHSWLNKMLLFCSKISGPILITPWLYDKKY